MKLGGIFVCCVFESVDSRTGYAISVCGDEQQTDNSAGNEIGGSKIFYGHSLHLFSYGKNIALFCVCFLEG